MNDESQSVAEARRQVAEARERFWGTFNDIFDYAQELQDKLAPSHIARDAWEAAKSKGADMAEDAVDAVRKRPVAASGAVAAIAMLIAREPLMDLAAKLWAGKPKAKPGRAPRKRSGKSVENA